jgi:ABC-type multidrug transport system ATPase subunit
LDDCLSAVDTKTEHQILNNLQEIMKGRTSVVISHRVSSAKLADKIIMLDGGHVIEQGTHEELMAKEGAYKELLRNNFKQKKLIRKLELTFIKFWSDDLALRYSAKRSACKGRAFFALVLLNLLKQIPNQSLYS